MLARSYRLFGQVRVSGRRVGNDHRVDAWQLQRLRERCEGVGDTRSGGSTGRPLRIGTYRLGADRQIGPRRIIQSR